MKQNSLLTRMMLLVALVLMGAGSAWASEASFAPSDFSGQGTSGTGGAISATIDGVTFACDKGYGTTQIRCYSGGKITISSANTITAISFTLSGSYTGGLETSYTGLSTTSWEKTLTSQARITAITVTYTSSSSAAVVTTTTIDATGITNTDVYTGTDAGSLSATVKDNNNNAISGATVTWSGNNDEVATIDENTGEVTLVAAGKVTFTAVYAGVEDEYLPSFATYEMTVTNSAPYVQPTTVEIVPNYTFWGKTAQFSGVDNDYLSGSKDNVTLEWSRGNGSTYANQNAMRFYKDNELTFTAPSGYEITSIELDVTGSYGDLSFSPDGYNSDNTTWSGASATVTMSRPSTASSYATISKFTITLAVPSTDPSISANDVNIAYDATSGSIGYTLRNSVDGGVLTAAIVSGGTIANLALGTIAGNMVPFTCDANDQQTARTATVKLTYTYNTSETVTKDVTITQAAAPAPAVVYTTIPELFDAATSTETEVQVTFDSWVVSGVSTNGKNVFVTDNDGHGFVIYFNSDKSDTFSAGAILSGDAVTCSLKLYNGFAELVNLDATDLTITDGATVSAANIEMANLAGVNTGALVSYNDLTCSVLSGKYYVSDGTTTIQLYNSLFDFDALEDGKTYNITGIYQQYNTTKEILPRSADDIEEVVVISPAVTLSTNAIDVDAAGETGEITVDYEYFNVDVAEVQFFEADGTTPATYDWIVADFNASYDKIEYVIGENTGAERKAYMKVYALDGDANELFSELITVTQAKYVVDYATLPFSWDGGASADFLALNGVTANGLGSDYAANNAPYLIKLDGTGDYIQVKTDGQIYNVTVEVKMIGGKSTSKITVQGSTNGEDFTDVEELTISGAQNTVLNLETTNAFDADNRYIRLTFEKGSNVGVGAITINFAKKEISDAGYATYCSDKALDYSAVAGLTAYKATVANKQVSFTEVTEVPANAGVLLKGAEGTYKIPVIASAAALEGNAFVGVNADTEVAAGSFVLLKGDSGVGFYKTTTTFTVGAHTAYLPASVGGARSFIGFDGETTGVNAVNGEGFMVNGPVYDLQGRRVAQPQKGLYIVNGRKVVVK